MSATAPSPLVAAFARADDPSAERRTMPLLAALARVSLAIAVREAAADGLKGAGEDPVAPQDGGQAPGVRDPAPSLAPADQPRALRPGSKRYGRPRLGRVRSRPQAFVDPEGPVRNRSAT